MKTTITSAIVCLALLSAAVAPAAAQNREHLQMAAELRMLQQQNQQLSLALSQLTEALKAVNARLDATEQFQQRRFADQEVLVKNLGSDLSAIRERTQDTDTRLRSLRDEIDALRQTFLSLPALLAQAQAQAAAAAAAPVDPNSPNPTPTSTGPVAAPPAATPPAPVVLPLPPTAGLSPNRLFDTADGDYAAGQYAAAIAGYEQVVKTFPTAERADDAQFFIGESLVHLKRLPEAIAAYNLVIKNYPNGDQADMAYYKRGFVESQMGQTDAARATWEELVKRYPDSQGAQFAKQRLAGVSRTAPPAAPAKP
jgi:tol-pal system protein YbgF